MEVNESIISSYSRRSSEWITTFFIGLFLAFIGYISEENSMIPPIVLYISVLIALIHGVWQLTTAYIIISNNKIFVKRTLFKIHRIDIENINSIKFSGTNIMIDYSPGYAIISLKAVRPDKSNILKEDLEKLLLRKENDKEEYPTDTDNVPE